MDIMVVVAVLFFVNITHSLDVTISGETYIEPGVQYNVTCTVDEYRDNRKTTFVAIIPGEQNKETIVWYYKPYGCYEFQIPTSTDCRPASCACDDNGLTTHWIYTSPSDLSRSVKFQCESSDNNNTIVKSTEFAPTITEGPADSLRFNPTNDTIIKELGQQFYVICLADCTPVCQFHWEKDNYVVSPEATLKISNLSEEDNGTYTCTGYNGYGTPATTPLYLTVNYGPKAVLLKPATKQYTVIHGGNIPPINCTAKCRPECEYKWFGPHVPSDTKNVLNLENIQKNQRGDFNCMATNEVGSMNSSIVNLIVQYEPVVDNVSINGSSFTVRENTTVILSCKFEGNPAPQNTWEKNNVIISPVQENKGLSMYTIQPALCEDNGNYSCVSNNSLGMSSAQQSLYVTCSPRLNLQVEQPNTKIGLPKGADLSLIVHFFAYPMPTSTIWIFNDTNGHKSKIASNFNMYEWFKHVTVLSKKNLTQYDFGDYILKVNNTYGSTSQTYHIVPQGPPDATTILNVTCDVNTAILYWRISFNGGEIQHFSILIHKKGNKMYLYDTGVSDGDDEQIKYARMKLSAGEYVFTVYGKNNYGNNNSTESKPCQVKEIQTTNTDSAFGPAAGAGTAAITVVIIATMLFVFIKIRRSSKGGLKDNPLYVSSGEIANNSGPIYSVVNKTVKSDVTDKTGNPDQGSVYSQVHKTEQKGKAGKDIVMESVYTNSKDSQKINCIDEMCANRDEPGTNDTTYPPTKNKDGLIYADMELAPCKGGNKFVIRGRENRNNYAIIDLSKTAEPLPSDDEDE